MLKNKIISLACAVAMITTLFVSFTVVNAETPVPTVSISSVEQTGTLADIFSKIDNTLKGQWSSKRTYPLYKMDLSVEGFIPEDYTDNGMILFGAKSITAYFQFDDTKFDIVPVSDSAAFPTNSAGLVVGETNKASFAGVSLTTIADNGVFASVYFVPKTQDVVTEEAAFTLLSDDTYNTNMMIDYYDGSSWEAQIQEKVVYSKDQAFKLGESYVINKAPEPELADFAALNDQIAAFEALTEADYTTDSWAVAEAAYDKAKAIDQATETNQAVVDAAAQALADAIAALKAPEPPVEEEIEVVTQDPTENKYDDQHKTVGIGGTVTVPEGKSFTSLVFDLSNGTKNGTYTWEFGTAISATVTFGLNIWNTPADVDVTVTSVTAQ